MDGKKRLKNLRNTRGPRMNTGTQYTSLGFECLEHRLLLAFNVTSTAVSTEPPQQPIAFGSDWKYLDDGTDQGADWAEVDFDDSSWSHGPGQLGYGDGDESTLLQFGADSANKFITTYFRHEFDLADPASVDALSLSVIRDDGVAVYLNGHPLLLDNLPENATYQTFAEGTVGGSEESTPISLIVPVNALPVNQLIAGTNLVSAEVHQAAPNSSDISFDLSLETHSNARILTVHFDASVDPLSVDLNDLQIDSAFTPTSFEIIDSNTVAFVLPTLSVGTHSAMINEGAILNASGDGIGEFTGAFSISALPQFHVNHSPRLQLGDAPLIGFAGSELDQVEVLWQTVTVGTGTNDTFSAEIRKSDGSTDWIAASGLTQNPTGSSSRIVHSAKFEGLSWDSSYEYRIQHRRSDQIIDTYQHTFQTRLQAGDWRPFRFVAYGDSAQGDASGFRQVQGRINAIDPDFAVLLGDNIYSSGTHNESDARFDPTVNPEAAAWTASHIDYLGLGNHDVETNHGRPSEDNFAVPVPVAGVTAATAPPSSERDEHNFSWDYGGVHFLTFDTNSLHDPSRLEGLLDWAVADLNASDARWKIVYGHHPVAGVPDKSQNPGDDYYQQVVQRLNDAGVDMFMVGHSHTYSWTYPLTGQVNGNATFTDGAYDAFSTDTGLPQLVAGVGGRSPRSGNYDQFPFVAAGFSRTTATPAELGFAQVDVTPETLTISYVAADDGAIIDSFTITNSQPLTTSVIEQYVFYNDSAFDNDDAASNAMDDQAIATDKIALKSGQATYQNYTSYANGITGLMVDIEGPAGEVQLSDFSFRVGNNDDVSAWAVAATPEISTRLLSGSLSRITFSWPDGMIRNTWLQTTVKATSRTGLAADNVFYFGNAVGESGDCFQACNPVSNAFVNAMDFASARDNGGVATIESAFDFNRDGFVDAFDMMVARDNTTDLSSHLELISIPESPIAVVARSQFNTIPNTPRKSQELNWDAEFEVYRSPFDLEMPNAQTSSTPLLDSKRATKVQPAHPMKRIGYLLQVSFEIDRIFAECDRLPQASQRLQEDLIRVLAKDVAFLSSSSDHGA